MDADLRMGVAAEAAGHNDEAVGHYDRALARAKAAADRSLQASAHFHLARLLVRRGRPDPQRVQRHVRSLRRLLRENVPAFRSRASGGPVEVTPEEVEILHVHGRLLLEANAAEACWIATRRLRPLTAPPVAAEVRGEALRLLGLAHLGLDQTEEAIRLFGEAAAAFGAADEGTSLVHVLAELGKTLLDAGCYRDGMLLYRCALEDGRRLRERRRLGDPSVLDRAGIGLAACLTQLGGFEEARALLEVHDPDDSDLHRDAALARVTLDLLEGIDQIRMAEFRRYEDASALGRGLQLLHAAEERAARILANRPIPSRGAIAQYLLARASWTTAVRAGDPPALARARELAVRAATDCARHTPLHLAREANRLVEETSGTGREASSRLHATEAARRAFRAKDKTIRRERAVEMARAAQDRLVGPIGTVPSWATLAGRIEPASEAFGDYWAAAERGGVLHVVAGDMAGHDVEAAVVMAPLVERLRTHLTRPGGVDPGEAIGDLNDWLLSLQLPHVGTSLVWAALDRASGFLTLLRFSDAGCFVLTPSRQVVEGPARPGLVLGTGTVTPGEVVTVEFPPGSLAFLYTDGVRDHPHGHPRAFGDRRLRRVATKLPTTATPRRAVEAVFAAHGAHDPLPGSGDDRTLVVVRAE